MRIPDIRERLHEIADDPDMPERFRDELHALAEGTRFRRGTRRTPETRPTPDPEAIAEYARRHPAISVSDLARHFNTNQGRISEILSGKRT